VGEWDWGEFGHGHFLVDRLVFDGEVDLIWTVVELVEGAVWK
jgi:hypothetical protein